jgi:hypothetical protein
VTRLHALEGGAAGFAAASALAITLTLAGTRLSAAAVLGGGAAIAVAGALIRLGWSRVARRRIARMVEARAPECRNLVITAAEILESPGRVRPYIGEIVCRDASRVAGVLDLHRVFPGRHAAGAFVGTAAVWLAAALFASSRPLASFVVPASSPEAAALGRVDVVVTPPEYSGRTRQSLRDPARIEALAGSRVSLTVTADATSVSMETIAGRQTLAATTGGGFTGEIVADADGFVAIASQAQTGRTGERRLIGLTVTPDHAPRVRVTTPGHDLYVPDGRRVLDLALDADDDLGLASLRVRYTKVSGSEENFTFTEGEVPLAVDRKTNTSWSARGTLKLESLNLEPGDLVVYRGVAADRRPGAAPVESDTFIVEITEPGAIAAEGFAVDEDRDRYALSQQMIILRTERLAARRSTMPAEEFADAAIGLAAEQRHVRAGFVFMMGGELADAGLDPTTLNEEEEAHNEGDLAAGYHANQGRLDLLHAIRSMSLAAGSLHTSDLQKALVDERAALASLLRAFARNRYILRALTERERLDLSRRLTGVLAAISRAPRPEVDAPPNPRLAGLRQALAGVAALAGEAELSQDASGRAAQLAQSILRVDPSAAPLQKVAAKLTEAADAIRTGRTGAARAALVDAAGGLTAETRTELLDSPSSRMSRGANQLDGLLADALRRRQR